MKNLLLYISSFALLIGCGGTEKVISADAEPMVLEKDSIRVTQILVPSQGLMIKGDLLLVPARAEGADTLFYAYKIPECSFLYGAGCTGEGPSDFSMPILINQDYSSDHFSAYNVGHNDVCSYKIDAKGFSLDKKYKSTDIIPRTMVNDSIAFGDQIDWLTKTVGLYTQNIKTGEKIDSIHTLSQIRAIKYGYNMSSIVNAYHILGCGENVSVSYQNMNRMELYTVAPDGKITLKKAIGDERLDSKYTDLSQNGVTTLEDVELHFMYGGAATDKCFYVVNHRGASYKDVEKESVKTMPVDAYTWDGELVGRYLLPKESMFAVNEKDKMFYVIQDTWSSDFEYIYTFKFK